jgi:hypothetical protein
VVKVRFMRLKYTTEEIKQRVLEIYNGEYEVDI